MPPLEKIEKNKYDFRFIFSIYMLIETNYENATVR
jgi:hypothetical protein